MLLQRESNFVKKQNKNICFAKFSKKETKNRFVNLPNNTSLKNGTFFKIENQKTIGNNIERRISVK